MEFLSMTPLIHQSVHSSVGTTSVSTADPKLSNLGVKGNGGFDSGNMAELICLVRHASFTGSEDQGRNTAHCRNQDCRLLEIPSGTGVNAEKSVKSELPRSEGSR